jgi:hypothetical protein
MYRIVLNPWQIYRELSVVPKNVTLVNQVKDYIFWTNASPLT